MKRDGWLIPFSHEHQHGLAQAHRLRRAARTGDRAELAACVEDALAFAAGELATHMASEEAELLPLVSHLGCLDGDDAARVAAEHLRLRTLRVALERDPDNAVVARQFAEALHAHIRWEERHLFQRWQQALEQVETSTVNVGTRDFDDSSYIRFAAPQDEVGANGLALGELNATNVTLAAMGRIEPASIDRDIAYVVIEGEGQLIIHDDDVARTQYELTRGLTVALARGTRRELVAGPDGLRFTTMHLRRGRIEIRRGNT